MEFAPHLWRTSTHSGPGGQCVEVAMTDDAVGIRDTKNRQAGHVTITANTFTAFIHAVKRTDGWRTNA